MGLDQVGRALRHRISALMKETPLETPANHDGWKGPKAHKDSRAGHKRSDGNHHLKPPHQWCKPGNHWLQEYGLVGYGRTYVTHQGGLIAEGRRVGANCTSLPAYSAFN